MSEFDAIVEGLKNEEFFLEYLPTVELESGRCIGAEALSRWRRISSVEQPSNFIPAMENTALSGFLTYWVVEQVARDFLDWLKVHDAFIGINVPPEVIGRGGIGYVLVKTGLFDIKDKIVFEITERGVPDRNAMETINWVTQLGVRVALDDVGTGGANLLVLARCDVEMIKIDRHVVAQVHRGRPLPANLETLAPLLKTGKLKVIAEGVETAEQAEALKGAGVRLAQGFHFSRPLSAEAFKTFFAERSVP